MVFQPWFKLKTPPPFVNRVNTGMDVVLEGSDPVTWTCVEEVVLM